MRSRTCAACHLVVVGDGDAVEARRRAEAIGVADRLALVGETDQPERYYAAADVFVLPSAYESFSIAAYEAAASGLPVVATAVGAIPELVQAGGGIQIEPNSADLATALERLAADPFREIGDGRRRSPDRGGVRLESDRRFLSRSVSARRAFPAHPRGGWAVKLAVVSHPCVTP